MNFYLKKRKHSTEESPIYFLIAKKFDKDLSKIVKSDIFVRNAGQKVSNETSFCRTTEATKLNHFLSSTF